MEDRLKERLETSIPRVRELAKQLLEYDGKDFSKFKDLAWEIHGILTFDQAAATPVELPFPDEYLEEAIQYIKDHPYDNAIKVGMDEDKYKNIRKGL